MPLLEDHLFPEGSSLVFRDLWVPACVCRAPGTEQKGLGPGDVVTTADKQSAPLPAQPHIPSAGWEAGVDLVCVG